MNVLLVLVLMVFCLFVNPISAQVLSDESRKQIERVDSYHPNYQPPASSVSSSPYRSRGNDPLSTLGGSIVRLLGMFGFVSSYNHRFESDLADGIADRIAHPGSRAFAA